MTGTRGVREPTHYDVLGVAPGAPPEEVRRGFLDAARRHHPDYHAGGGPAATAAAEEEMRKVNAAWSVLKRPEQRCRYDEQLRLLGLYPSAVAEPARSTGWRRRSRPESTESSARTQKPVPERAEARRGLGWVLLVLGLVAAAGGLAVAQPLLLTAGFVTAVAAGIVVSFVPAA